MTFSPANSNSSFLPIQFEIPEEQEAQRQFIDKRERLTASILNVKENANYEKRELLTAQQWFTQLISGTLVPFLTFRTTFDLVELNAGVPIGPGVSTFTLTATSQPPLIPVANGLYPVHMFGAATTAGPLYLPLPYAAAAGNNIEIWFDNTVPGAQTINIDNAYGANLTTTVIVFEYWKI